MPTEPVSTPVAASFNTSTDLTLQDSTVSGNGSVAGGVAGIGGGPTDHLTMTNTIDTGNTGGTDLGGFNGAGGLITTSYSDVCTSGAPLTGTGDICAAPALVSATDVHETAASPTIDKGSNALVPAGLSTDFFGGPRILAGSMTCTVPFPAAIVDIGRPNTNRRPYPARSRRRTRSPRRPTATRRSRSTTPALSACTANTKRLAVTAASSAIAGSKSTKLTFSSVAFYIDKGVKHTTHERRHKRRITVTIYGPNATTRHLPTTINLSLAGLDSGTHALRVVLSDRRRRRKAEGTAHKKAITVTKTLYREVQRPSRMSRGGRDRPHGGSAARAGRRQLFVGMSSAGFSVPVTRLSR